MELRQSLTRTRSGILAQSIFGVEKWLMSEWDKRVETPRLKAITTDQYKQGEKLLQLFTGRQSGQPMPMPYALIIPAQIALRNEGFNRMAVEKIGLRTGRVNGGRHESREKFVPVDVGLGVRFTTNDIQEALMFGQLWAENMPLTKFNITQKSTGYKFPIVLAPDPNVDIPADREENESLNVFTTVVVKTFSGTTEINKLITKISLRNMSRYTDSRINPDTGEDEDYLVDFELSRFDRNGYKVSDTKFFKEKTGL